MRGTLLAAAGAALLGCGGPSARTCSTIAAEYVTTLQQATRCDPAAADVCTAQGVLVDTRVADSPNASPTGQPILIVGLCLNCPVPVNASGTSHLKALLARYSAVGCSGTCTCPAGAVAAQCGADGACH